MRKSMWVCIAMWKIMYKCIQEKEAKQKQKGIPALEKGGQRIRMELYSPKEHIINLPINYFCSFTNAYNQQSSSHRIKSSSMPHL